MPSNEENQDSPSITAFLVCLAAEISQKMQRGTPVKSNSVSTCLHGEQNTDNFVLINGLWVDGSCAPCRIVCPCISLTAAILILMHAFGSLVPNRLTSSVSKMIHKCPSRIVEGGATYLQLRTKTYFTCCWLVQLEALNVHLTCTVNFDDFWYNLRNAYTRKIVCGTRVLHADLR